MNDNGAESKVVAAVFGVVQDAGEEKPQHEPGQDDEDGFEDDHRILPFSMRRGMTLNWLALSSSQMALWVHLLTRA